MLTKTCVRPQSSGIPYLEVRPYGKIAEGVFGEGAIHPSKRNLEGRPAPQSCWWGHVLEFAWQKEGAGTMTIPEEKMRRVTAILFLRVGLGK